MNRTKKDADIHFKMNSQTKSLFLSILSQKGMTISSWFRSKIGEFIKENM